MNPNRISKEEFSGEPFIVGRSRKANVYISGINVSRRHARLTVDAAGRMTVTDLQSSFGTFVNNVQIIEKVVQPGDLVRFGDKVVYGVHEWGLELAENPDGISLTLRGVSIGGSRKTIVENLSFDVRSNTFLGILGPSGCGKSTLLKTLATYGFQSQGDIYFDDIGDVVRDREQYIEMLSYVPQDDVVYQHLTVEEHLRYTAKLQIKSSPETIEEAVEQVQGELGLEKHRHKLIAKLSGGQRKRLSVAMEMMKHPRLLLLDEPTAGLDPATESRLMAHFLKLSQRGTTVICTTHMLDNMDLFDELVVLGVKNGIGSIAFVGRPGDLLDYFGEKSLVRVYERLERGDYPVWGETFSSVPDSSVAPFIETDTEKMSGDEPENSAASNEIKEFLDISSRQSAVPMDMQIFETFRVTSLLFLRDRWLLGMVLLQPVLLGTLACVSQFNQSNVVPLFFLTVIIVIWLALNNSTRSLVHERGQYLRDHLRGLTAEAYISAKIFFYFVLGTFQIVLLYLAIFTTLKIAYNTSNLIPSFCEATLLLAVVLPLTYIAGLGLGFFVSTIAKTEDAALAALPLLILPQLLISPMAAGMIENKYEDRDRMRPLAWTPTEGQTVEKGTPIGNLYGTMALACYSRPATMALEIFNKGLSSVLVMVECLYLLFLALLTWFITCKTFQRRQVKWYTDDFH